MLKDATNNMKLLICNAASEQSSSLGIVIEREGEKHGTATDWIHNRKQRAHHQKNALRDVKHSLALPREAQLTMASRAPPDLWNPDP